MLQMLNKWNLKGTREPGMSGVWVNDKKLGAIGVHVSHWVTRFAAFNHALLVRIMLSLPKILFP